MSEATLVAVSLGDCFSLVDGLYAVRCTDAVMPQPHNVCSAQVRDSSGMWTLILNARNTNRHYVFNGGTALSHQHNHLIIFYRNTRHETKRTRFIIHNDTIGGNECRPFEAFEHRSDDIHIRTKETAGDSAMARDSARERERGKAKKANKIETKQFDSRFSWTNPLARNSANELPTLTDAYPHNATVPRILLLRIKWCHHVIRYETVKFRNSTSTQTCMTFKWSRFFDRAHARHPSCNLLCEWV